MVRTLTALFRFRPDPMSSTERENAWLTALLLVDFDIDIGQVVRMTVPSGAVRADEAFR